MSLAEDPNRPSSTSLSELGKHLKGGGSYDLAISAWATAHLIPIPPSIVKRIRVGVGRLIEGSFDSAMNAIRRRDEKAEFNAQRQQEVVSALTKEGQVRLSRTEPDLALEVARAMFNEHGLKLRNRTAVVEAAFAELHANPPSSDETPDTEMDVDWLNRFAETASLKSNPDMQTLMGKILAGEIRKPGSFSQLSVNILASMSQEIAQKFQTLCSVSFRPSAERFISTDVFPSFLTNGIPEIDFTYSDLLKLRSYQLLAIETGSGYDMKVGEYTWLSKDGVPFVIAPLLPDPHNISRGIRRLKIALFSPMGTELASLISVPAPEWFAEKVKSTFSPPNWSLG